jgi:hypothetical protein
MFRHCCCAVLQELILDTMKYVDEIPRIVCVVWRLSSSRIYEGCIVIVNCNFHTTRPLPYLIDSFDSRKKIPFPS